MMQLFKSLLLLVASFVTLLLNAQTQSRPDWMARLADTVRISELNMPGSRQTTYLENSSFFSSWYYIQSGNVAEHLDRGIRVLDIWLKADGESGLKVYYDKTSAPYTPFADGVLTPVSTFLQQHSTETVLILVRAENDVDALGARLDAALAIYADKGYITGVNPSVRLGNLRGKFVIVRCGSGVASSVSQDLVVPNLWPRDVEMISSSMAQGQDVATLQIADYYRQSGTSRDWGIKKASLLKNLDDAAVSAVGRWYLSFAGFERTSVGPAEFSRLINPFVATRITDAPEAKLGIVMLDCILGSTILGLKDYSTEQTLASIVATNDRYIVNKWTGMQSSDATIEANWAAGRLLPSDGSANLIIDTHAQNPLAIADTASYLSIDNPAAIGIYVKAGGLLRLLGEVKAPEGKSGIRLCAEAGKPRGSIYFADPTGADRTSVEVEVLPHTRVLGRWEYVAPLTRAAVPVDVFGKRSVSLWDGKGWLPADSTVARPPFCGFAIASSADGKAYVYKGHLMAGAKEITFEQSNSSAYTQQFVGNSFVFPLPINRIVATSEVDPTYYQIVSASPSDYLHTPVPSAPTSAGWPLAVPQQFAGLHGLPSMIDPGEAFFVFSRGGSLSLPYTDPLAPLSRQEAVASSPIPALLVDLLSPEGQIIDRTWLFFGAEYTAAYDLGYDAYKLHAADRAELMLSSEQGALQVAALPTPSLARFLLRPALQAQGYSLRFSPRDGADALIEGYNIVDHYNGSIHPLEPDKLYTVQMQPGETQRSFTIGRPEDTSMSLLLPMIHHLSCVPTSDGCLRIDKPRQPATVRIYDVHGAVVASYLLPATEAVTTIRPALSQGLYIVRLDCAGGTVVERFVR